MKTRGKDLQSLILIGIGLFLILCLFSHSSLDPSWNTWAPGREVQNLGGVVGSYIADTLLVIIGYASYLIPLVLFLLAAGRILGLPVSGGRYVAMAVIVAFSSVLAHLWFSPFGERSMDPGGFLGWGLEALLAALLGRTGTYFITVAGLVTGFFWLTDLSLAQLGRFLKTVGGSLAGMSQFAWQKGATALVLLWVRGKRLVSGFLKARVEKLKPKPALVEPKIQRAERPLASPPPAPTAPIEKTIERVVPGPRILPRADVKEPKREQLELIQPPSKSDYQLPPLAFLDSGSQTAVILDEESLKLNSKLLEKKLMDYGVEGKITKIHPGPIITMYEFEPASGVKVNKIVNLEDDLALTMGGKSVRIIAPLPGKAAVGIEIPNNERETVWLKDVIGHAKFQKADPRLTLALGKDTEGLPFTADLARMPHLLVAGATGSGKSVAINSMILSLLYKAIPSEVRLLMIDLKMLELSIYEGIPHLLLPVVTQPRRAGLALHWAVKEMERRYEIMAQKAARNIIGYNRLVSEPERLPYIVVIIDELADLMMTTSHEVERLITRLAQMARAAGIHLILATQRPSVDVLTGLIKANFPARISFKVTSKHDSRTIIDTVGSEHLLGFGDMLFMSGGTSKLLRVHGAYVSEEEIVKVVGYCKQQGKPNYLGEEVLKVLEEKSAESSGDGGGDGAADELYDQAVGLVTETRLASISMVQRRLRIGYNRAARMIERMEKEGVVGPADGAKPREVFAQSLANIES